MLIDVLYLLMWPMHSLKSLFNFLIHAICCNIETFITKRVRNNLIHFEIRENYLKLNSRDTARHLRMDLGTLASCSILGKLMSSWPCQNTLPVSASRNTIQFTWKALKICSAWFFGCSSPVILFLIEVKKFHTRDH